MERRRRPSSGGHLPQPHLHQGAIQVEDLTENLYRMYNCDHRVSSTGPSWPPFKIWTDAAGQILFSLSACNVSMPTLTNFIQQVPQDQFQIICFFCDFTQISVLLIGTLNKSVLYRPFSKTQTAGRGQCGLGTRSLLPQIVGW